MYCDLFTYKGSTVVINNPNVLAIEEFRNILDEDKNIDKKLAFRTFTFLYLYCDLRSFLNKEGYNDDKAFNKAREIAKLPEGWQPNETAKAAITLYKSLPNPVERDIYLGLKRSFRSAGKVIEKSRAFLETLIDKEDQTMEDIKNCQYALEQLIDFASKLPKQLRSLDEAERMIEDAVVEIRGKKVKRASHDPENDR